MALGIPASSTVVKITGPWWSSHALLTFSGNTVMLLIPLSPGMARNICRWHIGAMMDAISCYGAHAKDTTTECVRHVWPIREAGWLHEWVGFVVRQIFLPEQNIVLRLRQRVSGRKGGGGPCFDVVWGNGVGINLSR